MIVILFSFVFLILLLSVLYFSRTTKNLPPLESFATPLLGHIPFWISGDNAHLLFLIEALVNESTERSQNLARVEFGLQTICILCDPDDFVTVSNACLAKPSMPYSFMEDWLGRGVFTVTQPHIWRPRRKVLSRGFTQVMLDQYLAVFNNETRTIVEMIRPHAGKGPFDHVKYMKSLTMENLMKTALNMSDQDNEKKQLYIKATTRLLQIWTIRITNIWLYTNFVFKWTELYKEQTEVLTTATKNLTEIIDKKKQELNNTKSTEAEPGRRFKPIIDCLLEMEETGEFTRKDVIDQIHTLVGAGYHTVAVAMSLILCMLGSRPRVQEKLYDELHEVFGDSDRDVDKQDLNQLVYLDAVVKEVLRLYPVAPVVLRYGENEVKLKNYTIPKGCYYLMVLNAANRLPAWGVDREVFRPERWLEPNGVPENAHAFSTFFVGQRGCIGKAYSMYFLKVAVAQIIRQYKIKANIAKVQLRLDLVFHLHSGHEISIENRRYND